MGKISYTTLNISLEYLQALGSAVDTVRTVSREVDKFYPTNWHEQKTVYRMTS